MTVLKNALILAGILVSTACAAVDETNDGSGTSDVPRAAEQALVGQKCSLATVGPLSTCVALTEYCNVGTACGQSGFCAAKPAACPMQYTPVCGCDGKTYANACVAASKGVSVRHSGTCIRVL